MKIVDFTLQPVARIIYDGDFGAEIVHRPLHPQQDLKFITAHAEPQEARYHLCEEEDSGECLALLRLEGDVPGDCPLAERWPSTGEYAGLYYRIQAWFDDDDGPMEMAVGNSLTGMTKVLEALQALLPKEN